MAVASDGGEEVAAVRQWMTSVMLAVFVSIRRAVSARPNLVTSIFGALALLYLEPV
jgi:hypothetical protein